MPQINNFFHDQGRVGYEMIIATELHKISIEKVWLILLKKTDRPFSPTMLVGHGIVADI